MEPELICKECGFDKALCRCYKESAPVVCSTPSLCICCHKNPVTWPLVCDECKDHEAQAALALEYGYDFVEGPYGDSYAATGMECRTCGMIYDGGQFCTYCGDRDPLDEGDFEDDDY